MNWMGVEELKGDESLLFINSGMAPMKKWFLNLETPPKKSVVPKVH